MKTEANRPHHERLLTELDSLSVDPPVRTEREGTERDLLTVRKDWADLLSKALLFISGMIYLLGYFVTASRLAEYGVPLTQLVNAQYFTAGIGPALLICLTIAVAYSAWTFDPRSPAVSWMLVFVVVLFLILLGVEIISAIFNLRTTGTGGWIDILFMVTRGILGQSALWALVANFRTGRFRQLADYFRSRGEGAADAYQFAFMLMLIAAVMIYGSYNAVKETYLLIPQAYGGGKPLKVRLYVEREKAPPELLPAGGDDQRNVRVYTVPLNLLFRTSDAFIVELVGDSPHRLWTLSAPTIHAIVPTPDSASARIPPASGADDPLAGPRN